MWIKLSLQLGLCQDVFLMKNFDIQKVMMFSVSKFFRSADSLNHSLL